MVSTAPTTIRTMPIVHRMEMPNTNPRISRMTPRTIMTAAFFRQPRGIARGGPGGTRARPSIVRRAMASWRVIWTMVGRSPDHHQLSSMRGYSTGPLWCAWASDWAELAEPDQMPFYEAVFEEIGSGSRTCLLDDGGELVQSGGSRHRLNTPPTTSPGW